jgi:hypothetical protein
VIQKQNEQDRDPDTANFNDNNFDKWGGFQGVKLFQANDYDEEDKEADEIYETVDK